MGIPKDESLQEPNLSDFEQLILWNFFKQSSSSLIAAHSNSPKSGMTPSQEQSKNLLTLQTEVSNEKRRV